MSEHKHEAKGSGVELHIKDAGTGLWRELKDTDLSATATIGGTIDVQEAAPLDVSGATVNVQEAAPLDVSGATVDVKTQSYGTYGDVSPSDSADETGAPFDALFVGGTGNIVVVKTNDATVTFTAVQAGTLLPIGGWKRIDSTSTTATLMVYLKY